VSLPEARHLHFLAAVLVGIRTQAVRQQELLHQLIQVPVEVAAAFLPVQEPVLVVPQAAILKN
jgi:hypothetical protein